MATENRSVLAKLLVPGGVLYLGYLASQPPPARWMGLACLAIVTPFLLGWILGNVFGVGSWAGGD